MSDKSYKLYKSLSKEFARKGIASNRFSELEQLYKIAEENQKLRHIIEETLWMARRYADGRSTYAPATVNECIMMAEELNIDCSGPVDAPYAKHGTLGDWDIETKRFEKE